MDNGIFKSVCFLNEEYDPHNPNSKPYIFDLPKYIRYKTGRLNKKELEFENKRKEEEQKNALEKKKKNYENKLKGWKDKYNITDVEECDKSFDSEEDKYNNIINDCKNWLAKIINSKEFKDYVDKLLSDEKELERAGALDPGMPKPSLSYYKSIFKIEEGVNGWKESISVCDGTQDECVYFNWVTYLIAELIEFKYSLGCDCGDGDEGHVYYSLK